MAFGRYAFRRETRQLLRNGEPVVLNGKAFDLLAIFLESRGRVLTREELYDQLWGDRVVEEANLSQTIYLLRRTLDPDGDGRTFIETIPRVGYRFVHPLRAEVTPRPGRPGLVVAAIALCAVVLAVSPWLAAERHSRISSAARDANELGEYHLALRTPDHLSYALAYFKAAERAAPSDALAYAQAAAAYALLAEFQADGSPHQQMLVAQAGASSADALARDADFSRALAVRGFIAYRFNNDRDAAARDLRRAVAADPSDAEAYLWQGVLFMTEGDVTAATGDFQTAHRLAPTSEVYMRWLARAYVFEEKPEQAIAAARETLRIEPDDAAAMLMMAQAQEQHGDLQAAINTLSELLRKDPYERPFVVPDVARLDVRLGNIRALHGYHVATLVPSGQADPFETALLYLTMGRKATGMQILRRADQSMLAVQRYDPRLLALL